MNELEQMTEPELLEAIRERRSESDRSSSFRADLKPGERSYRELVEELLQRHYPWLHRLCMLEFRFGQEADDCLQEVLIEIAKSVKNFDGRSELKTWLFVIVKRTIFRVKNQHRKRETRFPLGGAEDVSKQTSNAPVSTLDTEQLMAEREESETIIRYVRQLPEKQRWAVFFHYFEDLSLEETAVRLDCTVGTIKQHLFRGRQKLKDLMREQSV